MHQPINSDNHDNNPANNETTEFNIKSA